MFTATGESCATEPPSLRLRDTPATLKLETTDEGGASSQARGGAPSCRDSTSACSTSSLSTDFSATLSLSNDDIAGDFVVTSDSSAVVDFHDFKDFPQFVQTPPISTVHRDRPQQRHDEGVLKKESPFVNFLNRYKFVSVTIIIIARFLSHCIIIISKSILMHAYNVSD